MGKVRDLVTGIVGFFGSIWVILRGFVSRDPRTEQDHGKWLEDDAEEVQR